MDALQVVSSAAQIVSCMVGAVGALEQASRNLDEAPKRIRSLEEFVSDLENLTRRVKQKHIYKLHNSQLDHQIQSLNTLIERLHPNIRKARTIVSKNRVKNLAKVVWSSVVGDSLSKLIGSIRHDLNWWIEMQKLSKDVEGVIESTARDVSVMLRINTEHDYPASSKCSYVRKLLEQEDSHRVILIVGLSGIGKSCLARQVASDPPRKFAHGAAELRIGQWCSRAACNGSKFEYHKRLAKKICRFLVQIGFRNKVKDEKSGDLEDVCCLLQEALTGKSILILLDDVWEQDVVERFARLYDNDCRYLVTTRNEAVHEITEAEKVEICKDDIREISKGILLYHSLLNEDELPSVGESLLEHCGHHPLTVAVMGKALRKETRTEKWEQAIRNLSTYATCAPGPVSYVNEKEAEDTLTIFGSFEFSLEAMPESSRQLFIVLAAVSWAEPVPETCIEALWSVLGQDNMFPLVVCKLIEGSLLTRTDSCPMYHMHDMVSLYLDGKINEAVEILLIESSPEDAASVTPWLFVFGKEMIKLMAEQKMVSLLSMLPEKHLVAALDAIVQALMASKSISELEASSASFSNILGPRIADLISSGSSDLIAAAAKAITNIFTKDDYCLYVRSLETAGAVDKLTNLLENSDDPTIQTVVSTVVAKMAEYGSLETVNKVLSTMPVHKLSNLLDPDTEEWHESVFTTLMSLTKAGKSEAVERMFAGGIDKKLIVLLENGSDVAQHRAIVALKTFYELGGSLAHGSLKPGTLSLLPWHARFSLERFVMSEKNIASLPMPQAFEDLVQKIVDGDNKQVSEAMQDIIPIIEKAGEPSIQEMILRSPLVERLAALLQYTHSEHNRLRSESAFVLMKLACSGGEPFIRKFLENIVPELLKMMQCNVPELQDSAYTALHQMLFGTGGPLVSNRILQAGLVERLSHSLESKLIKTKEVNAHCLVDLVEVGSKACIERIFSSRAVEKLANLEKMGGDFTDMVVRFIRGLDKCKNLSAAERRVMKQQVIRKVRTAVKGHKYETRIVASVEACVAEGLRGASTSKNRRSSFGGL